MKKVLFIIGCILLSKTYFGQNVGINTSGATPNASALLDIDNGSATTKKGLLIPRMTQEERTALTTLAAAAKGLLIYQTNGVEGFYYNTSTTTTPNWVYLYNSVTGSWATTGNSGTSPSTSAIGSAVTNNFIGTTDNKDVVLASNNLERMRITGGGLIGINTIAPTSNALLTINPTTNGIRNGIDMTMSGATGTAYGLNITTATSSANGVFYSNSSSTNSLFFGVGAELTSTRIVAGYNAYRNSSGSSYGIYGVNGTTSTYATNANTWAAFLQGRTVISSESAPTSAVGTDLEIRNTSTGSNPVNVGLRQTTANTTASTVLGNLFFGDNNSTSAQAQISAIRSAASSGTGDLPTDLTFATTPDGSSTVTERMRITQDGNVLIGTTTNTVANAKLTVNDGHIRVSQSTPPTFSLCTTSGTVNAGTGATATLSANSNDVVGRISLTSGTTTGLGDQITVIFNKPYTNIPFVILTPANNTTANQTTTRQMIASATQSGFSVNFGLAPFISTLYMWNYLVIEP